jgi:hypothetical protein
MEKSKHGMTSEQARQKKLMGHQNEDIVANEVGGVVLVGNKKGDIRTSEDKIISAKTGTKTQWSLYCENTMISGDWNEAQKQSLIDYINFLPDSKEDYKNNRTKYKTNPYVSELYNAFKYDYMGLIKFFCGHGKVDLFHLTDIRNNESYQISSNDFFENIENAITRIYTTPGGKFVIAGGRKDIILFELELRKGTNHKKVLFHSHLSRIIDVIK